MSELIKCIIVDDEPLAIKLITRHINELPNLVLVDSFQNPLEAFDLLKKEAIDLIFLDIQMPVLTGIDFVKSLPNPPGIIFTTAFRNYAVESYELNVVDYIVKPITFTRFLKAVNKFIAQKSPSAISPPSTPPSSDSSKSNNHLYVNSNKKHIKINFDQILFVESIKDYVRIHKYKKNIITKGKISDFEKKLPDNFLRIHRSFIVNTDKITAFTAHDVEIEEKEIPIGGSYKTEVIKRLK